MIDYDAFQEEVRLRKRARWARILASEPPGRPVGRRPRDPEQERLLLQLDRARVARRRAAGDVRTARVGLEATGSAASPAPPDGPSEGSSGGADG